MVATKTQVYSDLNKPSLQTQTMSPLCSSPLDASSTSNLVHTLVDHITNPMPILATGKEEEERARQVDVRMESGNGGNKDTSFGERLAPDLARVDAELLEERWLVVEGGAGARATGGRRGTRWQPGGAWPRGRRSVAAAGVRGREVVRAWKERWAVSSREVA
uniref:Uncharacterized protein n=1 Tax=Oryza brachyantha TaxID=4533 RepID=J3LXU1_ORYBR